MLISAVLPIMSVYRLPQGQQGYRGHVINLPQDIASFANKLPRIPSKIQVLIVRKAERDQSHKYFRVRRSTVEHALHWLINNNIYYRNISIDDNALSLLPVDGDISEQCSTVMITDRVQNEETLEESDDAHITTTFVPILLPKQTEQDTIRETIHSQTDCETIMWPSSSGNAISEFTTEGYFSLAFPTLYPTGSADFLAPRIRPITIGNYYKHLMLYKDGRFAKHPRYRYFALNTEMRWRALQTGRIYVKQHPHDAQLTVDELRDMVGREGEIFSNRVQHYGSTLRGTRQYWFRQRSRLIAMVDTLGLPTIFFTHSAADMQWPNLARLICPDNESSRTHRNQALLDNPAVADWFFHHRMEKFIKNYYVGVLGACDYWYRYEWQHRGSPHVHGLAWLPNAPNAEALARSDNEQDKAGLIQYIDSIVSTYNPGLLPDGSNQDDAPLPKTDPHVCNKPYSEVDDLRQDLTDLIATCQRHTRCSSAYCLRTRNGIQNCRYNYPKSLQQQTTIEIEDGEPVVHTARNDGLINSYNPIQLSAWRANVDMQFCVSRRKVVEYCAKYATKSEPRSQPLKDIFTSIVKTLKQDNSSLKAIQKLLINTVGDRDYSSQETCHLLLQIPMFRASRDFVILSLDGSRVVQDQLLDDRPATSQSLLDHYISRPTLPEFDNLTLLTFAQHYNITKRSDTIPVPRRKNVVVIVRPYYSPDPTGPNYEQYCKQKLMLYIPFRQVDQIKDNCDNYIDAYMQFLQSGDAPTSLDDDIFRLEQEIEDDPDDTTETVS